MAQSTKNKATLSYLRGLGKANEGTRHWWLQRFTAIVLTPLTVWLILSLLNLVNTDHLDFIVWVAHTLNAVLLITFLAFVFYHAQLGMQVVLEDYVSPHRLRVLSVRFVQCLCLGMAVLSIFSILKIVFES
ncbi:MAG: succinate dehydrogenase, hydrophobic membrane anchor protein [Rhodospirillaceae bacterium]|nr:succinate dehydrogenase, hydrophobic membrane anchor protein [Rhodospirillaceae bacterium]|tara:strand:+ start:737 stop:1129 length:393 start_codon:yes stop_codon:yes gene_type:complete